MKEFQNIHALRYLHQRGIKINSLPDHLTQILLRNGPVEKR